MKAILSLSGGLDSTTLLYHVVKDLKREVIAIGFNYGQNHKNELEYAKYHCDKLGVEFRIINLIDFYKQINHTSALLNGKEAVPTEEYSNSEQPPTYVSNRNLFFSIIMNSIAEEFGADEIYLGIQKVDEFNGYWDTSPAFVTALQNIFDLNKENPIKIVCPFVTLTKSDEILIGNRLGLDYSKTISCYKGENCGKCPTCRERIAAFGKIGLKDPIKY